VPGPAAAASAWQVIERGLAQSGGTARERAYLDAIATYFRDHATVPAATRAQAYERAMAALKEQFPADTEAVIFHALAVAANASTTDTSFSRQREVGRILEPLVPKLPDHPGLTHYLIHTYDSPRLASLGVDAAHRYADIAPAAYHAHHMPSHIFVRLGLWDENIAANEKSAEASREMEKKEGWNGAHNHRLHAYDYMVYGYLQLGMDRKARAIVDEVNRTDSVFPAGQLVSGYSVASIPARFALERNDWPGAANLVVRPTPGFPAGEAMTRYARGLGKARTGDIDGAKAEWDAITQLEAALPPAAAYWAQLVKAQALEVAAWIALAEKDTAGAIHMATQAADIEDGTDKHPVTPGHVLPAREVLADILLQAGRYADAQQQYEAVLAKEPRRARSVYGAARSAEMAGNTTLARTRIQEYIRQMSRGDRGR
jgi:tetratricopeptide (TPR) repeat protein